MSNPKAKIILLVGLVILAGLILLLLIMGSSPETEMTKQEVSKEKSPARGLKETSNKVPGFEEPEEIFSFRGEIVSLTEQEVQVRPYQAYEYLGKTIKAQLTPETKYIQANIANGKVENKDITFADLKVGKSVLVESLSNIKGKTEFEASKITIVNVTN